MTSHRVEILNVKLSGKYKIIAVRCFTGSKYTDHEFSVDKRLDNDQVIEVLKSQAYDKLNESLIGTSFNIDG